MSSEIEIVEQQAKPVLAIRKTTSADKLPEELGAAYQAIMEYMHDIGAQPAGEVYTAYYNMDMEHLDVEMGFTVTEPVDGKGDIKTGEIPAGRQVTYLHKGPYSELGTSYSAMQQWMCDNGCTPTGVAYEFYLNSPMEVPESELLTKIMFPLK